MRPPLTSLSLSLLCGALCLSPVAARAQQQEGKLMERLDAETKEAQKAMGGVGKGKSYFDTSREFSQSKSFDAKVATVKDFYPPQKFQAKDFLTGFFPGSKDFWMGDFKYSAGTAAAKEDEKAKKKYAVKSASIKDARDSGKTYATSEAETKNYVRKGYRDKFDPQNSTPSGEGWQGGMEVMTIDQVRDLLNKNK